ncbi:hypothetical protein F2P56_027506, partial [Juglans regia]
RATLSGQGSQFSSDQSNERSALAASYVAPGGRGGRSGRGARGGRDTRGNRTRGRESRKCTHCGRTNHSVDYCWDLHGRPSGSVNQAICQNATSPSTSSDPTPEMISISKDEYDQFLARTRATSSSIATHAHSGIGSTKLTDSISLSSVLYAPSFPFSLLSISQITQTLQCSVTFYPSVCIFQDLKTGKKIGTGHEAG